MTAIKSSRKKYPLPTPTDTPIPEVDVLGDWYFHLQPIEPLYVKIDGELLINITEQFEEYNIMGDGKYCGNNGNEIEIKFNGYLSGTGSSLGIDGIFTDINNIYSIEVLVTRMMMILKRFLGILNFMFQMQLLAGPLMVISKQFTNGKR